VPAAGCGGLSEKRVARVRPGETTRAEVTDLFGVPDVSTPDYSVYFDSHGRQLIVRYDRRGTVSELQYWPETEEAPSSTTDGPGELTTTGGGLQGP
jgi:hypothetical protein